MYKIGLCGKAGTGKNTVSNLLEAVLELDSYNDVFCRSFAFADPIKQIVKTMFPSVSEQSLYGPSHLRNEIIEGARDAEGNPLTIRRALLDIGTKVGRGYNHNLWLDNMGYKIKAASLEKVNLVTITDVRFRNEFDWLKLEGFFMIKVVRENLTSINHISETGQDEIKDEEYNYVLNNNSSIDDLRLIIRKEIITKLS